MATMLKIKPDRCKSCGEKPAIYKRVAVFNAYRVECDGCGTHTKWFQCVEDADCAWSAWQIVEKDNNENGR